MAAVAVDMGARPVLRPSMERSIPSGLDVLHLVWLGDAPLRHGFEENAREWRGHFAHGVVWTDQKEPLHSLQKFCESEGFTLAHIGDELHPGLAHHLDGLFPNYGAASDILRIQVLEQFGGAYVDWDVPPTRQLLRDMDGIKPGGLRYVSEGNDFIMGEAGHPLFAMVLDEIEDRMGRENHFVDWEGSHTVFTTGPFAFHAAVNRWRSRRDFHICPIFATHVSTGSWHDEKGLIRSRKEVTINHLARHCLYKLEQNPIRPDWRHIRYVTGDEKFQGALEKTCQKIIAMNPSALDQVETVRGLGKANLTPLFDFFPVAFREKQEITLAEGNGALTRAVFEKAPFRGGEIPTQLEHELFDALPLADQREWEELKPGLGIGKLGYTNSLLEKLSKAYLRGKATHFDEYDGLVVREWEMSTRRERQGVCFPSNEEAPFRAIREYNRWVDPHGGKQIDLSLKTIVQIQRPEVLFHFLAKAERASSEQAMYKASQMRREKEAKAMLTAFIVGVVALVLLVGMTTNE